MLASLLPGIREVRAPLAAGYLWFVFGYLAAGAPDKSQGLPAPVRDLVKVAHSAGSAGTAVALSFLAYLLGSLSQDVFGRVLPTTLDRLSRRFGAADLDLEHLRELVRDVDDSFRRVAKRGEPEWESIKTRVTASIFAIREISRELTTAGASESERPEARRPMVEAEENLRVAILPPLVALTTYLTISDSWAWLFGLLFSAALYAQAADQHSEARSLAQAGRRGQDLRAAEALLLETQEQIQRDNVHDALDRWERINWPRILGQP